MAENNEIVIRGARLHNLKGVDAVIERNKLTVVTGVSGSGKSSLVFDTLYAEGQRRYVESLSSYARQFLGKMNKPEVDYIKGISPAIAIEQKVNTRNPRSTVATSTEIYDYLKLLFARAGHTFSPVSGKEVKRHQVDDVVQAILQREEGTAATILAPLDLKEKSLAEELKILLQKGFVRVKYKGSIRKLEELIAEGVPAKSKENISIVIDRISIDRSDEDELYARLSDSVQTAFYEAEGVCEVELTGEDEPLYFSGRFEADGIKFEEPSLNFFSFNNPYGACKTCEGFGQVIGIDEDLVVPDKSQSVYEGAVAPWRGETMGEWLKEFIKQAPKIDFPLHRAYYDLLPEEKELLWKGSKGIKGIDDFFRHLEERTYKIQYRVMLSRYRGKTLCHDCKGTRLRKDASYVKIVSGDKRISLPEILLMPVRDANQFFTELSLSAEDSKIADRILREIKQRLKFLEHVGLGYLSLNRLSNTLSGGESQRINLATSLGSSLVGSLYILDEPSIGLHSRDTEKLIGVLKSLRDLGNTVVVVEHDEDVMINADRVIDMGPLAGTQGGEVIFSGPYADLLKSDSLTGKYLVGRELIPVPASRRKWNNYVLVKGARENNLKNIDVKFPLHVMTVVTGVSGSGKTSLIKSVLYPALQKHLGNYSGGKTGSFDRLDGDLKTITQVEMIDQNPIGKSTRSNPVTYVKAYDPIRELFAQQGLAKSRAYKPQHFSFNVDGGRCEVCQGEGETTVEMQFMADLHLPCEACKGRRFKEEVLEITYRDKNIDDVLNMTVDDATAFFADERLILNRLRPLAEVGLGYVTLGQSSSTLSGGEAQRIKLASFIGKGSEKSSEHILFIFDEPTTGLHFHDIRKLLASFEALIKKGNSVLIIEHNPDIIKCADWVIDLGPDGGDGGGHLVFEGTPEKLVQSENSWTGKFLASKLR